MRLWNAAIWKRFVVSETSGRDCLMKPTNGKSAKPTPVDGTAAVTALLDRLLHHAHVLKCGPRSWRTKVQTDLRTQDAVR